MRIKTRRCEVELSRGWLYVDLPGVGKVFAERLTERCQGFPLVEACRDGGMMYLWVGRWRTERAAPIRATARSPEVCG